MTIAAETNIYEAIGGDLAIAAGVDDLYARILVDPELRQFFAGTNMTRLRPTDRVLRGCARRPRTV